MARLVVCSSCNTHVRADESACPHCGGRVRSGSVARTAGAVLMGLSLTACPADDDTDDTGASSATMTSAGSSSGTTADPTTMSSTGSDSTGIDPTTGPGPEPAYGVGATTDFPMTSTGADTDTDTDTEGSSSGDSGSSTSLGGPEYGVPETSGR